MDRLNASVEVSFVHGAKVRRVTPALACRHRPSESDPAAKRQRSRWGPRLTDHAAGDGNLRTPDSRFVSLPSTLPTVALPAVLRNVAGLVNLYHEALRTRSHVLARARRAPGRPSISAQL